MDYCVITFSSTHGAMLAERTLKGTAPFVIMPVLREISKGCGMSLRFAPGDFPAIQAGMRQTGLPEEEYAFYGVTGHGSNLTTMPLEKQRC